MVKEERQRQLNAKFNDLEKRLQAIEELHPSTPIEMLALKQVSLNSKLGYMMKQSNIEKTVPALYLSTGVQQPSLQAPCSHIPSGQPPLPNDASPTHKRLHHELRQKGFSTFKFVRVAPDYYDQPLSFRQAQLGAASPAHLCKSIIMENTRAHPSILSEDPVAPENWANPMNSRYYVILVQYAARLNADKLKKLVHQMSGATMGKQFFNFRLAPGAVSDALSDYTHNAVTPVGMKASSLPIILSHKIAELEPNFFYLGAGETDLKTQSVLCIAGDMESLVAQVGMLASEFVDKYNPLVFDITY